MEQRNDYRVNVQVAISPDALNLSIGELEQMERNLRSMLLTIWRAQGRKMKIIDLDKKKS
ncbi:MAG: hypothetical protein KDD89_05395 [Anaerolineales bacterium]|nr:hypothetical protein [Anaerolineales bacterium]